MKKLNNMMIEDVKDLKDKIYEIEGLLELAQLREDKIAELEPLIMERIRNLTDNQEAPLISDDVAASDEGSYAIEEKEITSVPEVCVDTEIQSGIRTKRESEISEDEPYVKIYDDNKVDDMIASSGRIETPKKQEFQEVRKHKQDKPAFCLNDRFRFKRELFSNSDSEFSSAMNMIVAMDSYDEAEEYFIGELGWDEENQEVIDFMEIIRGYFEA